MKSFNLFIVSLLFIINCNSQELTVKTISKDNGELTKQFYSTENQLVKEEMFSKNNDKVAMVLYKDSVFVYEYKEGQSTNQFIYASKENKDELFERSNRIYEVQYRKEGIKKIEFIRTDSNGQLKRTVKVYKGDGSLKYSDEELGTLNQKNNEIKWKDPAPELRDKDWIYAFFAIVPLAILPFLIE